METVRLVPVWTSVRRKPRMAPEPPTRPASIREADRGATVRGVLERRYHLYTGPLGAVTTLGTRANGTFTNVALNGTLSGS